MPPTGEHHSDVEEPEQDQESACFDWMITSGAHYAKNRSFFTTYQPIDEMKLSNGSRVIGIGKVELQVPRERGKPEIYTLVLENVLHTPDTLSNGFNPAFIGNFMYGEHVHSWNNAKQPM
ncbi:hypothetical protein FQN49_005818 [Arthroderma sp. PD_2]|nr:hypothetical protein FQN49_005818 [Arthroderma sp. PD_2]